MKTAAVRSFVVLVILLFSCTPDEHEIKIAGEAQGTTYHITYYTADKTNYANQIDSLLRKIDVSLSTYVPGSIISRINRNEPGVIADEHFKKVFAKAQQISQMTGGKFDATVAPVINAWGFGFTKKANVDSVQIDSLLQLVGYNMVSMQDDRVAKTKPGVMLDFNAIAQGYTVDVIAEFLEQRGITNFMVELGGEVRTKGKKSGSDYWKIGIDQPKETQSEERPLQAVVKLENNSLATSGNYRKFYVENGKKYAHIIDPQTGFPAKHSLLSARVIAADCMTADAFATAFMVMGMERAKQFLSDHKELDLEVFFIYDENGEWKTFTTEGLKPWMEPPG